MNMEQQTERPNILFVMADQLRHDACGFENRFDMHTPRIHELARQGVRYTDAVSMAPLCGPFRASLLSGCFSSTTGYVVNEVRARTDLPALAGCLNDNGYRSAYVGKWHLYASEKKVLGKAGDFHQNPKNQFVPKGEDRLGFDDFWAAYNFNHNYYNGFYYMDKPERHAMDGYEPDVMTDVAVEQLETYAEADDPFFMCVSYGTPHQPWEEGNVPVEWFKLFDDVEFGYPDTYRDSSAPWWHEWFDREWWVENIKPNIPKWQKIYHAMTANLDWNVGRLLDALSINNMVDNTIVVFTSDHGEMFGAQGRVQKNIFYDEAERVPFIMRWPGHIPHSMLSDACLNTPDIMPTLLSLAGVEIPESVQGTDLAHTALGKPGADKDHALLQGMGVSVDWLDGHEWRALRSKRYTYGMFRDGTEELFDNVRDPLQKQNLAQVTQYRSTAEKYREILSERLGAIDDSFMNMTWYRDNWIENGAVCGDRVDGKRR